MTRKFSVHPTLTIRGREFRGVRGWAGKPSHPPLTDVPIGLYLLAGALDVASFVGGTGHTWSREFWHAGTYAFVGGVAVSVLAALSGFWDAWKSSEAGTQGRRTINVHATVMVIVTLIAVADLAWRLIAFGTHDATPLGVMILLVITAVLVAFGATFGGTLVFDYGFNVETGGDHPVWHESEHDVMHHQAAANPAE